MILFRFIGRGLMQLRWWLGLLGWNNQLRIENYKLRIKKV